MNDCVPKDYSKYWPKKVEVSVIGGEKPPIVEDVQTLPHPVVVNLPKCGSSIKNRFLESMYLKYRHLLPKRPFGETVKAHPLDRFKTCYSIDYGLKEEPLEITRAPGSVHDDTYELKWQFKDPEMPYLPGTCDSITKSFDQRWPKKPKPKAMKLVDILFKQSGFLVVKPHVPRIKFRYAKTSKKPDGEKSFHSGKSQEPSLSMKYPRKKMTDEEMWAINTGGATEIDKLEKKPQGAKSSKTVKESKPNKDPKKKK